MSRILQKEGNEAVYKQTLRPQLGFLGTGWIGRNRMEVIYKAKDAVVRSVCEPDQDCLGAALKSCPEAQPMGTYEEMLQDKSIEGVVIATPSALHAQQAISALEHHKAVFCQKPLGRTADETIKVVKAAQQADKLLGVDLSYRFTKAMQEVYRTIRSGALGKIYAIDLTFHNAYGPDKPWFYEAKLSGGGCLIDLGVHLVDLALWVTDFPKVYNTTCRLFSKGNIITPVHDRVEDHATARLDLENDLVVNLDCSWNLHAGREAVINATFYGTQGAVSFKNINGSFYEFVAERYQGTRTEIIMAEPDDWMGRAAAAWAQRLARGERFSDEAYEFVKVAEVLDRLYGR